MSRLRWAGAALVVLTPALATLQIALHQVSAGAQGTGVPEYEVDPFWPKPLPNDGILGETPNVVVDPQDHVWVVTRPRTLRPDDWLHGIAADSKGIIYTAESRGARLQRFVPNGGRR